MTSLSEDIAKIPIDKLRKYYEMLLTDDAETDTYIRERVKDILTDFEINGDTYGVPTIEEIVDKLCEKIEKKG